MYFRSKRETMASTLGSGGTDSELPVGTTRDDDDDDDDGGCLLTDAGAGSCGPMATALCSSPSGRLHTSCCFPVEAADDGRDCVPTDESVTRCWLHDGAPSSTNERSTVGSQTTTRLDFQSTRGLKRASHGRPRMAW